MLLDATSRHPGSPASCASPRPAHRSRLAVLVLLVLCLAGLPLGAVPGAVPVAAAATTSAPRGTAPMDGARIADRQPTYRGTAEARSTVGSATPAGVVTNPANGQVLGTSTPTYTGTAPAGADVTVVVDGGVAVTTTASLGGGVFAVQQPTPLAQGSHTVHVIAQRPGDLPSAASATNSFVVDTVAPAAPVITSPAHGSSSVDSMPTFSGTAEASSTVQVVVDGAPVGTTTAGASGAWSITVSTPLSQGSHTARASARDVAGNVSASSSTTFLVGTPTAAPVLTAPANGSLTRLSRPTYAGTAPTGSTVTVVVDGDPVGATTAAEGSWSLLQPSALADGAHVVRATAQRAGESVSPGSTASVFTVDTTAPAAPSVTAPTDGSATSETLPTIAGQAEASSQVSVTIDGDLVGSTSAGPGGDWTLALPRALGDGTYVVRARSTDQAGNTGVESAGVSFTVDTTAPAAPVVTTPEAGSLSVDARPTVAGTAEPRSTVKVLVDGVVAGSVPVSATGGWSLDLTTTLVEGSHTLRATARDAVGNTSVESAAVSFTVDTTAPAAPVLTSPTDGAVGVPVRPTVTGSAEPGATVTVLVDGVVDGTTVADRSGVWSHRVVAGLDEGTHVLRATVVDAAGNPGPASAPVRVTVDTTPPVPPTLTSPRHRSLVATARPVLAGTAEPGTTVVVRVDGDVVGTTDPDAAGGWSLVLPTALPDGVRAVRVTTTDRAGNSSSRSASFTVDTVSPSAPVVLDPSADETVDPERLVVGGTAEPGSTVTVRLDGRSVAVTTATAAGDWSVTVAERLAPGRHGLSAQATDGAGNPSALSGAVDVRVLADELDRDRDGDGLSDAREARLGTDPTSPDTDGDGLRDGQEVRGVRVVQRVLACGRAPSGAVVVRTDPLRADTDRDGIRDGVEVRGYRIGQRVVPAGEAFVIGLVRSDPTRADTDRDGLRDGAERRGSPTAGGDLRRTDPTRCDTDRDGSGDRVEVRAGSDPTRAVSTPRRGR